jgi:hypothetical protein
MKIINKLSLLTLFLGVLVSSTSWADPSATYTVKVNNKTDQTPYVQCGMFQLFYVSSFVQLAPHSENREVATFKVDNPYDNWRCAITREHTEKLLLSCSIYKDPNITSSISTVNLDVLKCVNKTVVLNVVKEKDQMKIQVQQ